MADHERPDDTQEHIGPPHPAHRVQVREKLAATIALYRPVEPLHHPVQVPFEPVGEKTRQEEYGKLPALHAAANRLPARPYIPCNADLDPPGVAGGHPQVDKAVAEKGIEELLHGESLVGWRKYTFLFEFLKLFVRVA